MIRTFWYITAGTCVGIGMIGLVVPLLPTTPFVLAGGFAATRASPRLSSWLHSHPHMGRIIRDWHARRAIPRKAKQVAALSLVFSAAVVLLVFEERLVHIAVLAILATVGVYIYSRPDMNPSTASSPVANEHTSRARSS